MPDNVTFALRSHAENAQNFIFSSQSKVDYLVNVCPGCPTTIKRLYDSYLSSKTSSKDHVEGLIERYLRAAFSRR